jgi:hypothetical protein
MKTILTAATLLLSLNTQAALPSTPENYMICQVEINKDGKKLSSHLVTTFHPSRGIYQVGPTTYHYSATAASNCVSQPFNKKYNKENLYKERKTKSYIDLCYVISNGSLEGEDGIADFYLARRSVKEIFKFDYLNRGNPLNIEGTEENEQQVDDYEVSASCENKMLSPLDPIWSKIKKEKLGL